MFTARKATPEDLLKNQVRTFLLTEAQAFVSNGSLGPALKRSLASKDKAFVSAYQTMMLGLGASGMAKMRAGKLTAQDIK